MLLLQFPTSWEISFQLEELLNPQHPRFDPPSPPEQSTCRLPGEVWQGLWGILVAVMVTLLFCLVSVVASSELYLVVAVLIHVAVGVVTGVAVGGSASHNRCSN